ncbi:Techylectin-5A, partial [Araneus ventricosus]
KQNAPGYIMSVFYVWFVLLLLFVSQSIGKVKSDHDHKEKSESPLDVVSDMISKSKNPFSFCLSSRPVDCADVLNTEHSDSRVYTVWPKSRLNEKKGIDVFCDMDTDGGGWTIIQRRGNFSRPKDFFFKDWESYKNGFGDVERDFWLGNDNIFALTNQRLYSIRFDLKTVKGEQAYALYDTFWIDDEYNNYTLHIKDYSGTAGDSLSLKHNNQKFTTQDRDNDIHRNNCALAYKGGWWYHACLDANLNGLYLSGPHDTEANGVNWKTFKGLHESLDTTEMKIRPKNFRKKTVPKKETEKDAKKGAADENCLYKQNSFQHSIFYPNFMLVDQ